jgi:hypothetical protein
MHHPFDQHRRQHHLKRFSLIFSFASRVPSRIVPSTLVRSTYLSLTFQCTMVKYFIRAVFVHSSYYVVEFIRFVFIYFNPAY